MTGKQWQRMKELHGDALQLQPADREGFARNAAADDPEVMSELLRLLNEGDVESDLLSRPLLPDAKAISPDEGPRFAAGTVLARRFRIARFVARGGMGEVYEAEDLELGERVALKAIRRRGARDADLRALFKREIQLARRVTHPNVCRIFDLAQHEAEGDDEPTLLLSMELIEGQSLAEYLRMQGPLTAEAALPLIEEISAGLQAVHDAGIVHGDLKPGNVMLWTRPGETAPHASVMDFGMAFSAELPSGASGSPGPGPRGGTPDYLSPEQLNGASATTATDVYSFALLIGKMLGATRELEPDRVSARWSGILRRSLSNDPARRHKRPTELSVALRAALSRRSRTRLALVATGVATLALAVAANRIDSIRGTANRLLLTETNVSTIWRASPDEKWFVGTSWDTGDLVLREVGSTKQRRLTRKSTKMQDQYGGALGAVFSPDGHQIAYQWFLSRSDSEVRLIGTDGKGDRRLYGTPNVHVSLLDWSPDGKLILARAQEGDGTSRVGTLSTQDGSARWLDRQPAARDGILFAADGNGIVYDARSAAGNGFEIRRLSFQGDESVLVAHAGASSVVGWAPDRRRLIFSSDRRGQPGIWAVAVSASGADGEPRELSANTRDWEPLGVSRQGSLFYRLDASSSDVYTAELDLATGTTVSPPRRLSERFVGSYVFPNWSEDGTKLVFASTRERPSRTIGIYDRDTREIRELQSSLISVGRPQWVEHGAAVMALGPTAEGVPGMFRIDPRTGATALFRSMKELGAANEGVWSHDGRFHFNRHADQRRGIFRLDVTTGERRILYIPPAGVAIGMENLALSPNGELLAFHARSDAAGSSTLMLIPSQGGEARPLLVLKRPEAFYFGAFTWAPDSRRVLAARSRSINVGPTEERVSEIWEVPIDGSAPRQIVFPSTFINCLRMNPDGKTIAFQVPQGKYAIWALQNFL